MGYPAAEYRSHPPRGCSGRLAATRRWPELTLTLLLACPWAQAAPFAWITNQGSHDVSVLDLASGKQVATVPVGQAPAGVVAASARGQVFVANAGSNDVSVLDMRTHRELARFAAAPLRQQDRS